MKLFLPSLGKKDMDKTVKEKLVRAHDGQVYPTQK